MLLLCVGAAEASPLRCPLGQRARYVACSCEAHYVLIQIASWGLFVSIPASGRITARDMPPSQPVRALSCARRVREIDVHQHVKTMPVNVTLASGVWAWWHTVITISIWPAPSLPAHSVSST